MSNDIEQIESSQRQHHECLRHNVLMEAAHERLEHEQDIANQIGRAHV